MVRCLGSGRPCSRISVLRFVNNETACKPELGVNRGVKSQEISSKNLLLSLTVCTVHQA